MNNFNADLCDIQSLTKKKTFAALNLVPALERLREEFDVLVLINMTRNSLEDANIVCTDWRLSVENYGSAINKLLFVNVMYHRMIMKWLLE